MKPLIKLMCVYWTVTKKILVATCSNMHHFNVVKKLNMTEPRKTWSFHSCSYWSIRREASATPISQPNMALHEHSVCLHTVVKMSLLETSTYLVTLTSGKCPSSETGPQLPPSLRPIQFISFLSPYTYLPYNTCPS